MAEGRMALRRACGSRGRGPGRPGRFLLPGGVSAGSCLVGAGAGLEAGQLRDPGDGADQALDLRMAPDLP